MIKNTYIYLLILLGFACNNEDASDCLQTSGNIIQQKITVPNFERILVNKDVELIIKQATDYKVTIETGENLINDVIAEVIGNQLVLTDNNACNYVRDYGITKVYVETPTLTEIRCSTQYDISSDGMLNFPSLRLISEDYTAPDSYPIGDFKLNVNSVNLSITSNNISFFYINGQVENLMVGFYAGDGRFEGENLIAQSINIFHRGTNDIIVNPQQTLTGQLRSTGNLISKTQPPTVNVEQLYTGQLIFD